MMGGQPAFAQSFPGGKIGSFVKPSPLGVARPTSKGYQESTMDVKLFGVKKEWSGLSTPSTWDVKGEDLELVPWEFPLERTHREISAAASDVAARISDVLRDLSVEAEYCCKTAKAKCKTSDYVCFRIRLFAAEESGQPVVVEVQRRSGSASSFMRTCRAVLDAAEGKVTHAVKASVTKKVPPFMTKPIGSMQCLASVPKHQDYDKESTDAMDGVLKMLRSEKHDAHVLGLENLCALTDPVSTVLAVSLRVSKCVILGNNKFDIREEIRLLTEHDVFSPEFDHGGAHSKHVDHLRHLALCAFSNSLGVCAKDGCLAGALKSQRWFADNLIPSLVDELERVETNANNACQAARCIHSIIACSSDMAETLAESGRGWRDRKGTCLWKGTPRVARRRDPAVSGSCTRIFLTDYSAEA